MAEGSADNSLSATAQPEGRRSNETQSYNIPRKPLAAAHFGSGIGTPGSPRDLKLIPTKRTTSRSHQLLWPWALAAVTAAVYAITVFYALGTTSLRYLPFTNLNPSRSIALLRTLSEATSLCVFFLMNTCAERVMWIFVSRENGARLTTFLALHYGSGVWSWFQLIARNAIGGRLLSLLRIMCAAIVTAMGIVLLSAVKIQLSFDDQTTFPIAAGVGNFDPAYAAEYSSITGTFMISELSSLLQSYQVAWPMSVIDSGGDCNQVDVSSSNACGRGYFLHGGYKLVTPWPTENISMPASPIYTIHSIRGIQLDFTNLKPGSRFDSQKDCAIFGDNNAAIQLCISQYSANAINAKYLSCSTAGACLNDTSWLASTGWATTMTVHTRHATIHLSRANLSAVAVTDFSPPMKYSLSATDIFSIFNATFRATDFIGRTLYPSDRLVPYLNTYLIVASMSSPTSAQASLALHNLLAMPLYYFQPTYLSPYTKIPSPDSVLQNLPTNQGLYTTGSFSTFYYGLVVAPWSVYTYAIIMGVVVCLCLAILTMSSISRLASSIPDTTPWPYIDVAAECRLVDDTQSGNSMRNEGDRSTIGGNDTHHCAQQIKVTEGFTRKANIMANVKVKLIKGDL